MERYSVVLSFDAIAKGYPGWEELQLYPDEACWCLYETDNGKPFRLVATDGGDPEDQTLVRDWRWVPGELNKLFNYAGTLAAELADRTEENIRLKQQLKNLVEGE